MAVARSEAQEAARTLGRRSWENETDRTARTEPARSVFRQKFEELADPDGVLSESERAARGEELRREHYRALSRRGVLARQAKA